MKNVMVRAWEIAKEGVTKFGGKVKEYFAQALIMAWAEVKAPTKRTMIEVAEMIRSEVYGVKVNVWEKHNKRRIYVNKGFNNPVTMLEFDNDNNFIGKSKLSVLDIVAADQHGVRNELEAIYTIVGEIA